MTGEREILVFAKRPLPGRVKTRLLPVLAPREAAELHLACVADTLAMVGHAAGCRRWLLVAGDAQQARRLAQELGLSRRWRLGAQGRGDLGQRLARAFDLAFVGGARAVVAVGTDTPWMGAARIERAFQLLGGADVVLGPTEDGGYYLVGARRPVPEIFRGIAWGTSRVLAQTLSALRRARLSYRLLPWDFDLDRPADLRRVARQARQGKLPCAALTKWLKNAGL